MEIKISEENENEIVQLNCKDKIVSRNTKYNSSPVDFFLTIHVGFNYSGKDNLMTHMQIKQDHGMRQLNSYLKQIQFTLKTS